LFEEVSKMPRPTGPTNPVLRKLVRQLRERGKEQKVALWLDLAERLTQPRRSRAEVNLSHLSRYSEEGTTVVVPGKVLGAGKLDHPISVAAFKFSGTARRKIIGAGGRALTIQQLLDQNPEGKGVILME
jgi:large subunit ribosomal protein L18e